MGVVMCLIVACRPFIYMLNGDNGTDPFATEETRDNNWIKTGSHVMIVGAEAKSMMQCKACLGLFKHFQRWNIFSGMDLGPAVARFSFEKCDGRH
jgi:hypothetical protein